MKLIFLGAGGHARETVELARDCLAAGTLDAELAGYLVDPEHATPGTVVDGLPVLGGLDRLDGEDLGDVRGVCAVGAPSLRFRLAERARRHGLRFTSLVHPSVVRARSAIVGEGCMVAAGAVLGVATRLGDHVLVNVAATVAHDTIAADFATLMPGVRVAGHCHLGVGSFLGLGAAVVHRRRIGDWAIVGAGSTVLADVPGDATVVGSPARVVKRRPAGWHRAPGHEPV